MREIGFGLLCGIVAALGAFLIAAWPVQGRPVAAFFPAGSTARQMSSAIAEAGGALVRIDTEAAVTITLGTNEGYHGALYRAGAWLVVDAGLAQLCLGSVKWSER
ncbi:conserved hypothetical protein [Hyphomicrobiales bacterium]|nr:conserved hypothetical protein [Hyphomicrobiales bacterium]CAH1700199.1 conserved hypothetical protein [Hyphomicrobiales bacterium]CAI0343975.1 conserved hypothetical protein [Hyphomicrobiales bacterium]